MHYFILVFLAAHLCIGTVSAQKKENKKAGWTAVYTHDEHGNKTSGDIETLFAGLRNGYSLKIGWSWTKQIADSTVTLEHFAEPIFTTIIQKKYVSAIINPHPLLKSYIDISQQSFGSPDHIWQCILTTQGTFNAVVYKASNGELIKDWPQRHKMTWFIQYP